MENTIDQLNQVLFETLEKAKNKQVDESHVRSITSISSEILKSAKLQFDYHKYKDGATTVNLISSKNNEASAELLGSKKESTPKVYKNSDFTKAQEQYSKGEELTDYEKKCIVANDLGFDTVGKAISELTLNVFNKKISEFFNTKNQNS